MAARAPGDLKKDWRKVTTKRPCTICGRTSWCTYTADGKLAKCMRVESKKPVTGRDKVVGWIHPGDQAPAPPLPHSDESSTTRDWTAEARKLYAAGRDHRWKLAEELHVPQKTLELLRVGWYTSKRSGETWTFPMRDSKGKIIGIAIRCRAGKFCFKGSRPGLFFAPRHWGRPEDPILIPEGASDTAAILGLGLPVVGRPGSRNGLDHLVPLLQALRRPCIVIGENDCAPERRDRCEKREACTCCYNCWPGLSAALHIAQELRAAGLTARACLPVGAKDSRELSKQHTTKTSFLRKLMPLN